MELAGIIVTVAMPEALVSAVAGLMVALVASVLKETTMPATGAPAASLAVALTVVGAPPGSVVTVAPALSVSATLRLAAPAKDPPTE